MTLTGFIGLRIEKMWGSCEHGNKLGRLNTLKISWREIMIFSRRNLLHGVTFIIVGTDIP
jgi:hypothetical protein